MNTTLAFDSVDALRNDWATGTNLPFRPVSLAGGDPRIVMRVWPEDLIAAKKFVSTHKVTVNGHPIGVRVAIHEGPEPDPTLQPLRAQLVGIHADIAREAVPPRWTLRIVEPTQIATTEFVTDRLNLVVSERGLVVDVFQG